MTGIRECDVNEVCMEHTYPQINDICVCLPGYSRIDSICVQDTFPSNDPTYVYKVIVVCLIIGLICAIIGSLVAVERKFQILAEIEGRFRHSSGQEFVNPANTD